MLLFVVSILRPRILRCAASLMLGACTISAGLAQTALPPGVSLVGADALAKFRADGDAAITRVGTVNLAGPGFSRGMRVETVRDSGPAWAAEQKLFLDRAVAAGDVAIVRFFARAAATSDETGAAFLRVVVQQAAPDFPKSAESEFSIGSEWREFLLPFAFDRDYAAGAAELAFGFGFKRQTIELGAIDVVSFGKKVRVADLPVTRQTYFGREHDAAWRAEALARIEQIRKGDFNVRVIGADGQPVAGAKVRVEMKRNAFQFGSALYMTRLVNDTPDNLRYREVALELFNAASTENDLKWPAWDGEWGADFNRKQTLAGLRWMKARGFHVRGHVLVWPGWQNLPASIVALRGTPAQATIPERVLAHIAEETTATRNFVDEWDVINEPYDNHDLLDLFGRASMVDWFKAARAARPVAALFLNDYANHDQSKFAEHVKHFEDTARFLLEQGAPITGLGLQMHIDGAPNAPVQVLATLDRYAKIGLPIRITEFDVKTTDDELQADATRDYLILAFSHPSVVGFQFWGFWEGAHWYPHAAMYRTDWSEKPAAAAYKSLVLDQWRTRFIGTADAQGGFAARGFYGDYVATVEIDGRTIERPFTLRAGEPAPTIRIVAPGSVRDRAVLFDYDRAANMRVVENSVERRGDVTVRDISFVAVPGAGEKVIRAFLVVSDGAGPNAGALWVHWLGEPKTTNRTEFLEEAVALAPRGVVSLLVDAMWSAPDWYGQRVPEEDYANSVRQVIALRRAMDLLLSQPAIDRARVAVVGHDFGAMYSAIAAGLDSPARAYVYIAATPSLMDWAFYGKKPVSMENYRRQNLPLELRDFLREVKGGRFLMQFAERDFYVPLTKAQEFFAAAPEPKQMTIYGGAGHEMTDPASIRIDRDAFLVRELGLK